MGKYINVLRENKSVFFSLIANDFRSRYNGSNFGVVWGIIQPIVTIFVYWFVFSIGLRAGDRPDGTPYILWLICGMIPWFYISEALGSSTNAFLDYSYLVKKVNFRLGLIPVIKVFSAFIFHVIFVLIITVILNFYGYVADLYYLQLIYYMAAMLYNMIGLSLLTSSVTVFFRDFSQIVGIIIQVGFWVIPIVWGKEILTNEVVKFILELNPVFYIVEGYRETLLTKIPFWDHPIQAIYYWGISTVLFLIGLKTFRKLKGNFADVL